MTVHLEVMYEYGPMNGYQVFVDGVKYDRFESDKPLTHAQQLEVAANYEEALRGYDAPS